MAWYIVLNNAGKNMVFLICCTYCRPSSLDEIMTSLFANVAKAYMAVAYMVEIRLYNFTATRTIKRTRYVCYTKTRYQRGRNRDWQPAGSQLDTLQRRCTQAHPWPCINQLSQSAGRPYSSLPMQVASHRPCARFVWKSWSRVASSPPRRSSAAAPPGCISTHPVASYTLPCATSHRSSGVMWCETSSAVYHRSGRPSQLRRTSNCTVRALSDSWGESESSSHRVGQQQNDLGMHRCRGSCYTSTSDCSGNSGRSVRNSECPPNISEGYTNKSESRTVARNCIIIKNKRRPLASRVAHSLRDGGVRRPPRAPRGSELRKGPSQRTHSRFCAQNTETQGTRMAMGG